MAAPFYPPDIEGHVVTNIIVNPSVAADTNIVLDANDPKISLREIHPVISIDVLDFNQVGPSFTSTKFTGDNYGTAGALAATEMCVIDESTVRVGIALNVAAHDYIVIIKHIAGRTKNI